ncbi:hypothetical protein P154DRAFT_551403 [Amniculicola lignicola CBS 123094]|uniref:Coenzyme Q-binding protein COQ10 START domain-containing protein n=1 Tax=Amniculicola lignicola CBS 123094 TaxID=1392246 RepID=A0A6A5X2K7_9PLEO|nr:hypothetical protein P154DRAFT_551403 [Amniculicola lignicola CBS 123094]
MTAPAIIWPKQCLPGTTDNYVSTEVVVKGLTTDAIWTHLGDIKKWSSYYPKVSQSSLSRSSLIFTKHARFSFSTFGLLLPQCECLESVKPSRNGVGRLAWRVFLDGDKGSYLDVYHAWIGLTQESQIGQSARELAAEKPNRMLNGHQEQLDGLVEAVRGGKEKTELWSAS